MIDEIDHKLSDWARTVIGDAKVVLELPSDAVSKPTVALHLIDVLAGVPAHANRPAPLSIALRYVVTTWAEEPSLAHRMLGTLAFAAMENDEFEVEYQPLSAEVWAAFGVAPRPSFLLRSVLSVDRAGEADRKISRVRHTPEIRLLPGTGLVGLILGPGDVPLPRAVVELPSLNLSTRTDDKGRFRFPVLKDTALEDVRVRVKGQELSKTAAVDPAKPFVIHVDLEEN